MLNRSQIQNCALAAAHTVAALFDYAAISNLEFHGPGALTADKWPTIRGWSNELFKSGFVVDVLPDDAAQRDVSAIPTRLSVQIIDPDTGCQHHKDVLVCLDYKATIALLISAIEDVIQALHAEVASK